MCVILCTEIKGKQILAKNRDRTYKPVIEIIHEIINGIEVAYIKDKKSGWIEGMNENGFGLVNSTLSTTDGKLSKIKIVKKNNIIYKALTEKHIGENFYDIINDNEKQYTLEGHTILFYNNELIHFENNKQNDFVAEKIKNDKVYSNYGVNLKKEGYTKCNKGMSAFLRANIIKKELKDKKINSIEELTEIMNSNYKNINPRFHPYRSKQYSQKKNRNSHSNFNVSTTGQIVFNMTDLVFFYYSDVHNSERVKYINRLPKYYTPKIRIIIKETKKQISNPKRIFTKKYLKKIQEKFDCSKTKKTHKIMKNKTRKNR
jgi:hypothetical protein